MARALVLMGSGETSPTMVTPHQQILKDISGTKLILDTPYGFQENVNELTEKIQKYFFRLKKINIFLCCRFFY